MSRAVFLVAMAGVWGLWGPMSPGFAGSDRAEALRNHMVDEFLVKEGISNARVLAAMRKVPRHAFLPQSLISKAYLDGAWPIGHRQTISPPFIVAYMTETIDPHLTDRVLEIGTGSGYQAAVLGELAKEVYSIEIVEPLGVAAAARLKHLGYDNVFTRVGDGYKGWPEHAPFDKIIVTCSPENIPAPLVEQLREGGKMLIPLGERYQQVFHLLEKKNGKLVQKQLIPTWFVPMTGISEANRHVMPDPLHPHIVNGGFEIDANDDGHPDSWHYQRQFKLIKTGAPEGHQYLQLHNEEPGRLAHVLQGMAINGQNVRTLRISLKVKCEQVQSQGRYQQAGVLAHFYDATHKPIGDDGIGIGSWVGTRSWETASAYILVPPNAREVIVSVGLNGATGTLSADDVKLAPK